MRACSKETAGIEMNHWIAGLSDEGDAESGRCERVVARSRAEPPPLLSPLADSVRAPRPEPGAGEPRRRTAGAWRSSIRRVEITSGLLSATSYGYRSPGARWVPASRTTPIAQRSARPTSALARSPPDRASTPSAGCRAPNASSAAPASGPPTQLRCGTGTRPSPGPPSWPSPPATMAPPTTGPVGQPAESQPLSQRRSTTSPRIRDCTMNIEAAMTLPGQQTRSTGASTPFPRQQPRLGPPRFSPGTGQPGSEAAPIHPRDRRHHAITAKSAMPAVAAVLALEAGCWPHGKPEAGARRHRPAAGEQWAAR